MALTPGTRLGSLGAGGMGAVFRARDTKLDRDVAIKVLPEAFAHDADRLAVHARSQDACLAEPSAHRGSVLFEMLTGTQAFEGEDIADTLGNVMKVEPNWQRVPPSIPPRVVQVMRARFDGYDVAADGTLVHVYSPGAADPASQIGLSDRTGTVTPLTLPAGTYDMLRVSPDGTRVAVGVADPKEAYIAISNLDGRTAMRRLTLGGNHRYPIWSRDGQRVTCQSDREADGALFWQRADGIGPAERLRRPEKGTEHVPASWSPNDETLLFTVVPSGALWTYVRLRGTAAPFGGVTRAAQSPLFSPDGRWVAYASGDQGPLGLYVQPFPASGGKYQLPPPAGATNLTLPVWSPDGTALFFAQRAGQLAVTAVTTRPTLGRTRNSQEVCEIYRGYTSPTHGRSSHLGTVYSGGAMPLSPGARLGPYDLQSRLGGGGMGELWKAYDRNRARVHARSSSVPAQSGLPKAGPQSCVPVPARADQDALGAVRAVALLRLSPSRVPISAHPATSRSRSRNDHR